MYLPSLKYLPMLYFPDFDINESDTAISKPQCFLTQTRPRSKALSYLFTSPTCRHTHTLWPNPRPVFMPLCLFCCDIYTAQHSSWSDLCDYFSASVSAFCTGICWKVYDTMLSHNAFWKYQNVYSSTFELPATAMATEKEMDFSQTIHITGNVTNLWV